MIWFEWNFSTVCRLMLPKMMAIYNNNNLASLVMVEYVLVRLIDTHAACTLYTSIKNLWASRLHSTRNDTSYLYCNAYMLSKINWLQSFNFSKIEIKKKKRPSNKLSCIMHMAQQFSDPFFLSLRDSLRFEWWQKWNRKRILP